MNNQTLHEWLPLLANVAEIVTATGVIIAAIQLFLTKRQAVETFEDEFDREYRELTKDIPTKALLNEVLSVDQMKEEKIERAFYRYIDLSNGQAFLRQNKRISKKTWVFWCDGIESNMKRPAFKQAWDKISVKTENSFNELRLLMASEYKVDPADWPKK